MTLTSEQRDAWLAHKCIDSLTNPIRAGGYRCDACPRKQLQEAAK